MNPLGHWPRIHDVAGFIGQRIDRWRFGAARADYYDYLAELMDATQGRLTIKEIFHKDAMRYGPTSVRGRLSQHWLATYQRCGGDLYATWSGSFPAAELNLIRAAQHIGNEPLICTLRDLSAALRLMHKATSILSSTLWAAAAALAVLLVMIVAVPAFTVPRLMQTFSMVPAQYYGDLTRALLHMAAFVSARWVLVSVVTAVLFGFVIWSFPNLSGPLRVRLDAISAWRIYRYVHSLQFFSAINIVLARQGLSSTQLRTALWLQKPGASPWKRWHIDAMLDHIDAGRVGAASFDTGLLDRDLYWFFSDTVLARGLPAGLTLTRQRLQSRVLRDVAAKALRLRWALLLSAVACLLGLGIWHYAVIDELRRSLMLFYASH